MAQLPNPNSNKQFDRVSKDAGGQDEYGFRSVDGQEEIVHIPTGRSNMQYWQPEMVLNPEGCSHVFSLIDLGKRELECNHCRWTTSVHITDLTDDDGVLVAKVRGQEYQVIYKQ